MIKRLYISADLEGVCGVVSPQQCAPTPDRHAYDRAVRQLGTELSAVIDAAVEAGVDDILINDAHCSMTNLHLEQVPPQVRLLSGKPKPCAMMAGLSRDFDAAMLIGYHAKAGTLHGTLAHTFHHQLFDVQINGQSLGESGINILHAHLTYGVPVVLVSGDRALKQELQAWAPAIPVVETKIGLGHTSAQHHALQTVLNDYRQQVQQALSPDHASLWRDRMPGLEAPFQLDITLTTPLGADTANLLPSMERLDGCRLRFQADHIETVYRTLQSCYTLLASSAHLAS